MDNNQQNNPKSLNPFSTTIIEGISVFTAIRNRRVMLEKVLPTWLSCKEIDEIVIVDWSSDDGLETMIRELASPKIVFATVTGQPKWILSLAYNLAARFTSRSTLLKLDADVTLNNDFFDHHLLKPGNFYTGNWKIARNDNEKHLHGVSFLYRNDFFRVNGYNEFIKTYGWDDIDLYDRLEKSNLVHHDLNMDTLHHIEHTGRTGHQDHMKFLKTRDDKEKALLNSLINRFLVESTRSWETSDRMMEFEIAPGKPGFLQCRQAMADMHIVSDDLLRQCTVKAIIERFYELGVKMPASLLKMLNHDELVELINLYYQRNSGPENQHLYNSLLKFAAGFFQLETRDQKTTGEAASLRETLKITDKNLKTKQEELTRLYQELAIQSQINEALLRSASWKIGHSITSGVSALLNLKNRWGDNDQTSASLQKKFNLGEEIGAFYGQHRSGWGFAIASLKPLHQPAGILLDSFIERTFQWHPKGVHPHKEPWVGFIHVPPDVPPWFAPEVSNQSIFATPAWQESLPYCRGLFTLSAYHRNALQKQFGFPVTNFFHPTEEPMRYWNMDRFRSNKQKKVIQVGFWLRKLFAIHVLNAPSGFQKIFIRKENVNLDHLMAMERLHSPYKAQISDENIRSVSTTGYLSDYDYDVMLSENIVFIDLYDASANNSVIECIVRNTPILVNPIEPVVEYLGEKYPFYFNNLNEAEAKLKDQALIRATHRYLVKLPLKKQLSATSFLSSVADSPIYKAL